MQLDKNDVIRIRAAALKSLKDSGLRERALAGSKHHDDFIYCEKEFINLFSDAMDGLQASDKKYPIGGYAPGNYYNKCYKCGKEFQGDKRAMECEPCAVKAKEAFDALSPNEQAELIRRNEEFARVFFSEPATEGKQEGGGHE